MGKDTKPTKDPMLVTVNALADAVREGGDEVVGCSFCARHTPKKAMPCPYCGSMCEPDASPTEKGGAS